MVFTNLKTRKKATQEVRDNLQKEIDDGQMRIDGFTTDAPTIIQEAIVVRRNEKLIDFVESLSNKYGVKIEVSKEKQFIGCTKERMFLPKDIDLLNNDEKLLEAIIAHHVSHMKYTDFDAAKVVARMRHLEEGEGCQEGRVLFFTVINSFEDIRINPFMEDLFPGASKIIFSSADRQDLSLLEQILQIIYCKLCKLDDSVCSEDVRKFVEDFIMGSVSGIFECKTTQDLFPIVEVVCKIIIKEKGICRADILSCRPLSNLVSLMRVKLPINTNVPPKDLSDFVKEKVDFSEESEEEKNKRELVEKTYRLTILLRAIVKLGSKYFNEYDEECIENIKGHPIYKIVLPSGLDSEIDKCIKLIQTSGSISKALLDYREQMMKGFSKASRQKDGKVYTPPEIVKWIHDKLEQYNPIDLNKTYWEPSSGTGSFVIDWYERLMKHWIENKEKYSIANEDDAHKWIIEKCLFYSDIDPFAIRLCTLQLFLKNPKIKGIKYNSYCGDSLLDEPFKQVEKFDYVAGNPPYANSVAATGRKTATKPLWLSFVELVQQRTLYIGFVTPTTWLSQGTVANKVLSNGKIHNAKVFLNTKPFGNVLTTVSLWIASSFGRKNLEVFELEDDSNNVVAFCMTDFFPNKEIIQAIKIFKKTLGNKLKMDVRTSMKFHNEKTSLFKVEQDMDFKYPIFHTNQVTFWTNLFDDELMNKFKVILSKTGSTRSAKKNYEASMTNLGVAILVNTEEEASKLLEVLNSKLFRFLLESNRHSSTIATPVFKSLPSVDLTRSWTDQELYDHFNLTPEEVEVIEDTVK